MHSHLRSRGLSDTAQSLQQELDSKVNETNPRKRPHSALSGGAVDDSYLQRIFRDSEQRLKGKAASSGAVGIGAERVMSLSELSLQSLGAYRAIFRHHNHCRVMCAAFSEDGRLSVLGCADGCVRVLDVVKLHQSSNFNLIKRYDAASYAEHRPILCSLGPATSGARAVNEVHLQARRVVACSDGSLDVYELGADAAKARKWPLLSISECFNVRSARLHPAGDVVAAAGDACYVRLYDVRKEQGYIARHQKGDDDAHINRVRWAGASGQLLVACSERGDVRFYDARTLRVVNRLRRAHGGAAVHSLRLSKEATYLLTAGDDAAARLHDLRVGRQCMRYQLRERAQRGNRVEACLSFNDEHVVWYSQAANRIVVFDTNSGARITKFKEHAHAGDADNLISCLATSPTEPAFICASTKDCKTRFYATIKHMDGSAALMHGVAADGDARDDK